MSCMSLKSWYFVQIPPSAGCFGYIYTSLFNYEYVILILSGSSSYRKHIQQAQKHKNESEPSERWGDV